MTKYSRPNESRVPVAKIGNKAGEVTENTPPGYLTWGLHFGGSDNILHVQIVEIAGLLARKCARQLSYTAMNQTLFNYIVVGRGMIGSAAARHLSQSHDGVAIIGPDEPADKSTHSGVFGSHYDEGRITRVLGTNVVWSTLAKRSILRYRELQEASGVTFYQNAGVLWLDQPNYAILGQCEQVALPLGVEAERLGGGELARRFPFLSLAPDYSGLYEAQLGGYVSARKLVRAQTLVAVGHGARVINSVVSKVRAIGSGVEVSTTAGETYRAQRVLIATGGFANAFDFLPRKLELSVYARTVLFARLNEQQRAQLADMPSIGNYARLNSEGTYDAYILPPIQYPDGNFYVKIGMGSANDPCLSSFEELRQWFRSGGSEVERPLLWLRLKTILPLLEGSVYHTAACVTTYSMTGYPYIDLVEDRRIGIAAAGCGQAAKSSDELGRMAALMISNGQWAYDLPAEWFGARFS